MQHAKPHGDLYSNGYKGLPALAEVFARAVYDINPVIGVVWYDSSDPVCIQ